MIFRTKVLGGGGYNVAKNDSITPQNNKDNCQNQQHTSTFLQSDKNCTSAGINKNQSKNEIYKTKSNRFFRVALLSVWLFVIMLSINLIFYSANISMKNAYSAPDVNSNIFYVYAYYDKNILTETFTASYDGIDINEAREDRLSTDGCIVLSAMDGTGAGFSFSTSGNLVVTAAPANYVWKNRDTNTIYSEPTINRTVTPDVKQGGAYGFNWDYTINIELVQDDTTYSITYDGLGDGAVAPSNVKRISSVTIKAGTKTGYDFARWSGYSASTGSTLTIDGSTLSGDITLTANWVAQVYTITYNYAGDLTNADKLATDWGGKTAPITHTYDTPTQLVLPSRAKYKFDGWYTSSNCTGTKLTSLSATGYTANIVLYGKWTRTQSTITINIAVAGASGNGVILYLINGDTVQSQVVATSGMEIVLTQSVGENYSILVSKPYMWKMTVNGDCTLDAANKNKVSYTVSKTDANITLEFSGGASSSMIAV